MRSVYILWHTHECNFDESDSKLLGVYSSETKANDKIKEYTKLPGFIESPNGFEVSEYMIDVDYWQEGFVTETSK